MAPREHASRGGALRDGRGRRPPQPLEHAACIARAALGRTHVSPQPRPDLRATDEVTIVPANEASWEDIQAVFGMRGYTASCQCQWFKAGRGQWVPGGREERAFQLRIQTDAGHSESDSTSGLIAYLEGEPVGWCAVEPRTAYRGLVRNNRVPWEGRAEDKSDDSVWAVTCLFIRAGYRKRGISRALAVAAVDFARERGA